MRFLLLSIVLLFWACSAQVEKSDSAQEIEEAVEVVEADEPTEGSAQPLDPFDFDSFLSKFKDITVYMGNEDRFFVPSNEVSELTIEAFELEPGSMEFIYGFPEMGQLPKIPMKPVYVIRDPNYYAFIVEQEQTLGETAYYLITTSLTGEPIDAELIGQVGVDPNGSTISVFSSLYNFNTYYPSRSENNGVCTIISGTYLLTDGRFERSLSNSMFETLPMEWILSTGSENNYAVEQNCGVFAGSITFIVDADLKNILSIFTGQEAIPLDVRDFEYIPLDDMYIFSVRDPYGADAEYQQWIMHYDEPEQYVLKIWAAESDDYQWYVKKESVDNGSIQVIDIPCVDEG